MRAPWNRSLKPPEQLESERQERARDHISVRSVFVYLGPALIVSMAYMDPGNYGTDIQSGASFAYDLLWAVWMANLMAMLLQYLSGKLGIATGQDLAQLVRSSLKYKKFIFPYWLAAEAAAAATDLAEYLGTVIALNLLFGIPLLYASIFGAADVIILLALTSKRFRVVEYFFMLFVSVITIGFLYQVILIGPSLTEIAYHSVAVSISSQTILLVVGIVGATVMPHALFVHSTLTRNKLTTGSIEEKRRLRRLHLREVILTLTIAGLVNVAILVSAAAAFYPQLQRRIHNQSGLPDNGAPVRLPSGCRICDNAARFGPRFFDHGHACRHGDDGRAVGHPCKQEPSEARDEVGERLSYHDCRLDRAQSSVAAGLQPSDSQRDDTTADDSLDTLHEQEKGDGRVREQEDHHDSWDTLRCYHHLPERRSALHRALGI